MGPVMNLPWPSCCTAVVLYQGAEVPVYEDQPPVVGVGRAGFAGRARPASAAAIASCRVAGRAVDTWEEFFIAVGTTPEPRGHRSTWSATAPSSTRQVTPGHAAGRAGSRSATSACCPNVHPHVRARRRRASRPTRRAQGGRRHPRGRRRADRRSARSCRDAIAEASRTSRSPITILRDGSADRLHRRHARARRGGDRVCSASDSADETRSVKPGVVEALGMSVEQNVQMTPA